MSLLSAVIHESEKANFIDLKQQCNEIHPDICDLTEKIQVLSWAIHQNVIDLNVNFVHTKSLEQINFKNSKERIFTSFEKISERVKDLQNKYELRGDFKESWLKLQKIFEQLKDLCILAEGKRILWNAEHEFRRFNYSTAIIEVETLQKDLKNLKFEGDLNVALKNLRDGANNQLSLYVAHLSNEWEELFCWSEQLCLNHSTYSLSVQQCDPILMKNVLRALYLSQRLNDELDVFSDFFINKLLHNLIRHNCEIYTDEKSGAIIFNIKIDLTDNSQPSFQTIFTNLTAVFEFLQSTLDMLFESDEKFVSILAESIRAEFFNKIINDCIKTALPTCKTSYENYKNLVIELDTFNKFLVDLKFVKNEDSPLSQYMNTECVLHKKRYDKLLSDVRIIMKESLSYGTVCVGMSEELGHLENASFNSADKEPWDILSKPLFLPKCVVSQNVKKIMSLIMEHLEDCIQLPDKFRNQLVLYIKDIALMYQWLVPKQFKVNLESCPLDIALFFNNCFYLAHCLLGPSWRNVLPYQLADNLNTILFECIHDLRILGLEKVSLYLQKQKDIIADSILLKEPTEWTYDTFRQYNLGIIDALAVMKDLKCSWYRVLPTKMYNMAMCALVQSLCQCMLDRLLMDIKYITEVIILQIRRSFQHAIVEIEGLFEEPIELDKKINNWQKFSKMSELLNAQLLEICELWNSGKDLNQVYSCEEIRKIIKIRFSDDNIRLKILADIQ